MQKHRLFPALILVVMIISVSCSRVEDYPLDGSACAVNILPLGLDVSTATRTVSSLPQGNKVVINTYPVVSGTESALYLLTKNYTVSDALGTVTPDDGTVMMVPQNAEYMLYAVSPVVSFKTGSQKIIRLTQGTDLKIAWLDVLTTSADQSKTILFPVLTRLCADVDVTVQCVPGTYLKTATVGTDGVILSGITHTPLDYTLGSGAIDLTGVPNDGSCTIPGSSFVVTGNNSEANMAVLPKADAAFTLSAYLVLNGEGETLLTATVPHMAFTAGCKYAFTLTLKDGAAIVTLQVTPWTGVSVTSNPGSGSTVLTVGSWTLTPSTSYVGGGSVPLSVGNWVPNPSTVGEGTGSATLGVGSWNSSSGSSTAGSGSAGVSVGGWNSGSTTNTLGN